ncbi:MAG TPA: O-antigen ligase family protein [Burkholderiales bacterium]
MIPSPLPDRPSRAGLLALSCTEAMWLAILLALPLVMNVSVARSFEASKLLAVVPMAALAAGALLAALLERAATVDRALLRDGPVLAFAAVIASALLATVTSETPWVAFFGDYFRREGMVSWLIYAVLFGGLLCGLRRPAQTERLLDILLLATLPPCIYAVMQRFGFDFFLTEGLAVGTNAARPGGTMGNPTFLASVLVLMIPVTVTRVIGVGPGLAARAPWLATLALQIFAAVLSQSRGPLLGLGIALFVLLLLLGAQARARGLILAAFGAVLAGVLALALINFVPALSHMVTGTPLQRFVFAGADVTVDSRFGIWRAGVESFTHASWWRQLIGYGPDAASFNYYNWMPAAVQRNEGYAESIDRLHSEFLETLLSFGVAGLLAEVSLFSALVWRVAQRLLPVGSGRARWPAYAAWVLLGAAAGALLAYAGGGGPAILPIGAGAGLAAAWGLFLAWRAWRHARAADSAEGGATRTEALLLAAMVSALIGSWAETQVGVPTISTRALVAVFAALIPLTARGLWRAPVVPPAGPPAQPASAPVATKRKGRRKPAAQPAVQAPPALWRTYPVLGWAVCLAIVICIADFFPPLSGARMLPPSLLKLPMIAWPIMLTAALGLAVAWQEAGRGGAGVAQALARFLLWGVPLPILFAVVYALLGGEIGNAADDMLRPTISALTAFSFAADAILALLLAAALYLGDGAVRTALRASGRPALVALAAGLALAVYAYSGARTDYSADVAAKLSAWARNNGQAEQAAAFLRDAVESLPQERRFAGSYAARLIELAALDAGRAASDPAVAHEMLGRLTIAEQALARARELAPRDPWLTFSYANVQQFMSLKLLENAMPATERARHAELSRQYMALAHQQFPGHPWILRNWAQLEFDQGNHALAYAKLTEMEKLDPLNVTAYTEWVKLARMDRNPSLALAAVRRGLAALPPGSDDTASLLQLLIDIPRESGNIGGAISGALEYTSTQPQRLGAWRQLVELYAADHQNELALSNAQTVLARFKGAPLSQAGGRDYATLQDLARRLTYGMRGAASAGAPAAALAR